MNVSIVKMVDAENPVLGDLELREGQLRWINDTTSADRAEALAQRVRSRVMMVRGEWYLDQRVGTPWREYVWGKSGIRTGEARLRLLMKRTIEQIEGVREVLSLVVSIDPGGRRVSISTELLTDDGVVVTIAELDRPFIVRTEGMNG